MKQRRFHRIMLKITWPGRITWQATRKLPHYLVPCVGQTETEPPFAIIYSEHKSWASNDPNNVSRVVHIFRTSRIRDFSGTILEFFQSFSGFSQADWFGKHRKPVSKFLNTLYVLNQHTLSKCYWCSCCRWSTSRWNNSSYSTKIPGIPASFKVK